jgi:hypothetical protein
MKSLRLWVEEIWRENCEERLTYNENPATIKEYWNTYKYWLKKEYKEMRNIDDNRNKTSKTV